MATSNIKASFPCGIKELWDLVTSLEEYSWRRDLSKIDIVEDGKRFVEYTKNGYPTKFTITTFKPYERYEFDMENDNMKGHWTGIFSFKDGVTSIDFTENVRAKKWHMKPFVNMYLKKQQASYIADLTNGLKNRE